MDLKVRFRFNKVTGEVELFDVIDIGSQRLPDSEHNRIHDQTAAAIGSVIERNPRVTELVPGRDAPALAVESEAEPSEMVADNTRDRDAQRK
jgi:hypothetical protein